ncbi:hypothetical protein [Methylobacterium sp. WL6]|uniref:helix-turn-helix transcriptional regulator n=1 Tax=Methylobacterium sp. WL6 TaxID=2603901 RepID=UPI0016509CF3|nr:hypothetical protein [Methylobacterium sp. WL6]
MSERGVPLPATRLITEAQAASYCGLSAAAFSARCSVAPIDFGDRRLDRFDRQDLDAWIDSLKAPDLRVKSVADALVEFQQRNRASPSRDRKAP